MHMPISSLLRQPILPIMNVAMGMSGHSTNHSSLTVFPCNSTTKVDISCEPFYKRNSYCAVAVSDVAAGNDEASWQKLYLIYLGTYRKRQPDFNAQLASSAGLPRILSTANAKLPLDGFRNLPCIFPISIRGHRKSVVCL